MKCQYLKPDRTKCRANHINNSSFCFRHDPNKQEERMLASRKGGQNRALKGDWGERIVLTSPKDATYLMGEVINKVWTGEAPTQLGSSMGFMIRVWLDCYEASEIKNKLSKIEEKLIQAGL